MLWAGVTDRLHRRGKTNEEVTTTCTPRGSSVGQKKESRTRSAGQNRAPVRVTSEEEERLTQEERTTSNFNLTQGRNPRSGTGLEKRVAGTTLY